MREQFRAKLAIFAGIGLQSRQPEAKAVRLEIEWLGKQIPCILALCAFAPVKAQTFEVASIRPSAILPTGRYGNYRVSGGPGTNDPVRMILENFDLASLILKAYNIPSYLLSAPAWVHDLRFDVTANIPSGATKEQFLVMQQNLLITRMALKAHYEKKEMAVYELGVSKGGSKLKEASQTQGDSGDQSAAGSPKRGEDGFLVFPPGRTMYGFYGNRGSLQGAKETMEHFASTLAGQLQSPVVDATGLIGKYDFSLKWVAGPPSDDDPGVNLESAIPLQLGLTLRKMRGPVEVLVVDHIEKTPTEN